MAKYSLATYTIRVKDEFNNQVQIDNFGNGVDIFTLFNTYLTNLRTNSSRDQNTRKILRVENLNSQNRNLYGIIDTGEWGYESILYDINREIESHRRLIVEAEMLPFYYSLHLPRNSDEGIIILQRFQQYGIKGVFLKDFNNFFSSQCPGYKIEINPLVPERLINQYLNEGRITKIRFVRFGMPTDFADAFNIHNQVHVEQEGNTELVVSAGRNSSLPIVGTIMNFINGRRELRRLVELQNFEYDNIKLQVIINKNPRTIDLSHLSRLRAYYDITDDVQIGENGHPVFDSIHNIAEHLLGDLVETMYGEYSNDG